MYYLQSTKVTDQLMNINNTCIYIYMKWKFTKKQQQQRLTAADKSWADILFSLLGFNTDPCIL